METKDIDFQKTGGRHMDLLRNAVAVVLSLNPSRPQSLSIASFLSKDQSNFTLSSRKKRERKTISAGAPLPHRRFDTIRGFQGREGRPKFECRGGRKSGKASSEELLEQSRNEASSSSILSRSKAEHRWIHFLPHSFPFLPSFSPELETAKWSRRAFAHESPWSPASLLLRRRHSRLRRERRWRQRRRRRRHHRCRPLCRPRCPLRRRRRHRPRRRSSHLRPYRPP